MLFVLLPSERPASATPIRNPPNPSHAVQDGTQGIFSKPGKGNPQRLPRIKVKKRKADWWLAVGLINRECSWLSRETSSEQEMSTETSASFLSLCSPHVFVVFSLWFVFFPLWKVFCTTNWPSSAIPPLTSFWFSFSSLHELVAICLVKQSVSSPYKSDQDQTRRLKTSLFSYSLQLSAMALMKTSQSGPRRVRMNSVQQFQKLINL